MVAVSVTFMISPISSIPTACDRLSAPCDRTADHYSRVRTPSLKDTLRAHKKKTCVFLERQCLSHEGGQTHRQRQCPTCRITALAST